MSDDLRNRIDDAPVSFDVDAAWARFEAEHADALPAPPPAAVPPARALPVRRLLFFLLALLTAGLLGLGHWRWDDRVPGPLTTAAAHDDAHRTAPYPGSTAVAPADAPVAAVADDVAAPVTDPRAANPRGGFRADATAVAQAVPNPTAQAADAALGAREASFTPHRRPAALTLASTAPTLAPTAPTLASTAPTLVPTGRPSLASSVAAEDGVAARAHLGGAAAALIPVAATLTPIAVQTPGLVTTEQPSPPPLIAPVPPPPHASSPTPSRWGVEWAAGGSYVYRAAAAADPARGRTNTLGRAETGLLLRRRIGAAGWWIGLAADASRHDERYRYTASARETARVYHASALVVDGVAVGDSISIASTRYRRVDHVNHTVALDAGLLAGYDFTPGGGPLRVGVFAGGHYRLYERWAGLSAASAAERADDPLAVATRRPYADPARLRLTGGLRLGFPIHRGLTGGLDLRTQWGGGGTYPTPDGRDVRRRELALGGRLKLGYRF